MGIGVGIYGSPTGIHPYICFGHRFKQNFPITSITNHIQARTSCKHFQAVFLDIFNIIAARNHIRNCCQHRRNNLCIPVVILRASQFLTKFIVAVGEHLKIQVYGSFGSQELCLAGRLINIGSKVGICFIQIIYLILQ